MTNWTQEREAAARARCEAATKGPWKKDDKGWGISDSKDKPVLAAYEDADNFGSAFIDWYDEDRDFTAHARTDLPNALDEIERLREYTRHLPDCPRWGMRIDDVLSRPLPKCTCGLEC